MTLESNIAGALDDLAKAESLLPADPTFAAVYRTFNTLIEQAPNAKTKKWLESEFDELKQDVDTYEMANRSR